MTIGFVRAASTATGTISSPTTLSVDSTIGAGTGNRKLVCLVIVNVTNGGTAPGISATYNGNSASFITSGSVGGGAAPDLYRYCGYWDDTDMPSSGSANISVSFTTTDVTSIGIIAVLLDDAAQGAVDGFDHATNLNPSLTPTTQPGICLDFGGVLEISTWTPGTSFTGNGADTNSGGTGTTETSIHSSRYAFSSTSAITDSLSLSTSGNDSVARIAVIEDVPAGPTNSPSANLIGL